MSNAADIPISEILPHRYPMVMIDRIVDLVFLKHCVAEKLVGEADAVAPGPNGKHIFPHSLIVEAMAQAGGMPMHEKLHGPTYIASVENIEFEGCVHAGDVLRFESTLLWHRAKVFKASIKARTQAGFNAHGQIVYAF